MKCLVCKKKLVKSQIKFCSCSCSAKFNNKGIARHKKPDTLCKLCGVKCRRHKQVYCSLECFHEDKYNRFISRWLSGYNPTTKNHDIPAGIKKYLLNEYDNACQKCGWSEVNKFTDNIPLTVHHKDGNADNNIRENLELLCPNCHSLTDTYGARNKGNGRKWRQTKREKQRCG